MANYKEFKASIDLNQQQLIRAALHNISVGGILTPVKGQIVYNIVGDATYEADKVYYYNGTTWVSIDDALITIESSDDTITVNVPTPTGADINLIVNQGNIHHNLIDKSDEIDNPHDVNLNDVLKATGTANSAGGLQITSLGDGVASKDAVNKSQLDALSIGLQWKEAARAATIGNIDLATGGLLAIDGVTVAAGDRVLVKDQTILTENGIYVVAAGAWTRSTDDLVQATLTVLEGLINVDHEFTQTATPVVIGTTDLVWIRFGGASVQAGDGLVETGNVWDVGKGDGITVNTNDVAVAGDEIAGKGLSGDTTEAWKVNVNIDDASIGLTSGDNLEVKDLGVTLAKLNDDVFGDGTQRGTGLEVKPYATASDTVIPPLVDANGVGIRIDGDTIKADSVTKALAVDVVALGGVKKYVLEDTTIPADDGTPAYLGTTITHNLGERNVIVQIYEGGSFMVEASIESTGINTIVIRNNVIISRATVVIIG